MIRVHINIHSQGKRVRQRCDIKLKMADRKSYDLCRKNFADNSQWGETAQVHTMQLFSQSGFPSERAHYGTHWRETTQVQSMRLCLNSIKHSEEAQKDPLWGKASQMHNVRVFQHYNW